MQVRNRRERDIAQLVAEGTAVDEAFRRAGREALLRDKQLGLSVPVWRDGHTEWVPPDQIDALLRGTDDAAVPSGKK